VPIAQIVVNPQQPRRDFNPDQLTQLAQSITTHGILQPLVVASSGPDKPLTLIAGERRLRAAVQAGLASVPCIVRQATPQQMLEWALIENIHRAELNPIEKAQAYREYINRFALTQTQAAERLGEPRTTVSNYMRLLELQPQVRDMIIGGKLSFGHAKVLCAVGDPHRQVELAKLASESDLSVRDLEKLVGVPASAAAATPPTPAPQTPSRPAYLRDLEDQLTAAIGTKVTVHNGRSKNAGRIVIRYYNLDDFDRIIERLGINLSS
jgi:ParB family chromosome partitioning protein